MFRKKRPIDRHSPSANQLMVPVVRRALISVDRFEGAKGANFHRKKKDEGALLPHRSDNQRQNFFIGAGTSIPRSPVTNTSVSARIAVAR